MLRLCEGMARAADHVTVETVGVLERRGVFREKGYILRFIEYMDVGSSNGWRMDEVLPSADIIARTREKYLAALRNLLG